MLAAQRLPGPDAEVELEVAGPFDLRDVLLPHLRGLGDPTMRLAGADVWRATRTPDGPATLRLTAIGPGRVRAQGYGPGASWAVAGAGPLIGVADDPIGALESIDAHAAHTPIVRDLARRRPTLLRVGRTGRVIDALVPAILEQKVTGDEARRAWRFLVRTYGQPAPGPGSAIGLMIPPDPVTLAGLPYFRYHPAGVERRRAEVIRRAAATAGRLETITGLPIAEAYRHLQAIPGIGPWTAAEVAFRALGDADAVSIGDFHLPNLVSWALAGERRGSDARMLELLEPFAPHRARIVRLLEGSGVGPGRRGPRSTPRRIEAH